MLGYDQAVVGFTFGDVAACALRRERHRTTVVVRPTRLLLPEARQMFIVIPAGNPLPYLFALKVHLFLAIPSSRTCSPEDSRSASILSS